MKTLIRVSVLALLTSVLIAPRPAQADCDPFKEKDGDKTISQGEFAVLLAQALDIDRRDGWKCSDATAELAKHDIAPADGWQEGKDLSEGAMVHVIRMSGLQISTSDPGRDVSWTRAKVVVANLSRLFVESDGKFLRARPQIFETGRPPASPTEP